MRRRVPALALTILLFAAAASAQPKPAAKPAPKPAPPAPRVVRLPWAPSFEDALARARADDAPVLVCVYLTNHPATLALENQVFGDRMFRRLATLFELARVEATRRPDLVERFGATRTPMLVFLDSSGAKVVQMDANITPKRVLNAMGRTVLISMFNAGKREAKAGHARSAYRRFRMVQIIGEGTPPAQWSQREIDALNTAGVKKFSQAQIALDLKDYLKGMTILDELVYEYRGLPTGEDAKRLADKLADDPKAAEALKEVTRRRLAARALALAKRHEEKKELERALVACWDVARDYPNTPASDEACARAGELAKDADLAERARALRAKRDCENWLEMAAALEQNKLPDKARDYYKRVVDNYPGTPYAEKAKAALGGRK